MPTVQFLEVAGSRNSFEPLRLRYWRLVAITCVPLTISGLPSVL